MSTDQCPVLLVHGWNSHPGIWNRLILRLSAASFTVWKFDHSTMDNTDIAKRATALKAYIRDMRDESGYTGPVDIVCHSVGTCITRYLLEVLTLR